ncbi:MAG: hypothetical protein EBZ36_04440 [Acidobacteria bacterium]|nr:hypothetical protein [Acidobacteriota bacterium]
MPIRTLLTILTLCLAAARITAQGVPAPSGIPDEFDQNETLRDTLVRMQIKREESDFKKLVEKAQSIRDEARLLAVDLDGSDPATIPQRHEKRLREIEKFARQIRSESGGGDDGLPTPDHPSFTELVARLVAASERLSESISRTSRRVISVKVIESCSEVIDLTRQIRRRSP